MINKEKEEEAKKLKLPIDMTDTVDFPERFRSMQNWEEDPNQEL